MKITFRSGAAASATTRFRVATMAFPTTIQNVPGRGGRRLSLLLVSLAVAALVLFLSPIPIRAQSDVEASINFTSLYLPSDASLVGNINIYQTLQNGQTALLVNIPVDVANGGTWSYSQYFTPAIVVWPPGDNYQVGLCVETSTGSCTDWAIQAVNALNGNVNNFNIWPVNSPNAATTQTLYYGSGCSGLSGPCTPSETVYSGCVSGPCSLVPGSALYWVLYGNDPIQIGTMAVYATPEGGSSLLYLLLAGASCCGAMFFSPRPSLGERGAA
jgi:hypothetical protein